MHYNALPSFVELNRI